MKLFSFFVLSFFIFGCAQTGLVKNTNFQYLNPNDSAQIFIARSPVYAGDGNRFDINIDGWTIAKIYPSQYIGLLIPAGSRSLGVDGQTSLGLNFLKGEKYYFKTYISWTNFGIVIERITENEFYEMVNAKNDEGKNLYKDVSANMITY